jgi:hypothetical protein
VDLNLSGEIKTRNVDEGITHTEMIIGLWE